MHEESPEGGRFKKEIFINDQSYLLLIRDEGGVPEAQVCNKIASFHTYFFANAHFVLIKNVFISFQLG